MRNAWHFYYAVGFCGFSVVP
ncbi:DUF3265 domain-containing protein [Vibrio parahaemolyticus]|nr:DUF3265 domain-containing protein [Vibrio alginolyticus]MBE5142941.1 DUF3265 domain-containing protein [Vibrio parahaemolyticus]MBS9839436.1 DUF3265 domain-containing protein [Vibrio alginolyticus]MBS9866928.1 DUF3265 domain-containing protein [Vibrio alginolyticus]MBS9890022.1 DUF3265 domain-containing protein [Vibrio alginolyticus]